MADTTATVKDNDTLAMHCDAPDVDGNPSAGPYVWTVNPAWGAVVPTTPNGPDAVFTPADLIGDINVQCTVDTIVATCTVTITASAAVSATINAV